MTLLDALEPRTSRCDVRANVLAAREKHREVLRSLECYRGGLPAERTYAREIRVKSFLEQRDEIRKTILAGRGRRIDLFGILRQSRAGKNRDVLPLWVLVDPRASINSENGVVSKNGTYNFAGGSVETGIHRTRDVRAVGIPPIPQRVRELFNDPSIDNRSAWHKYGRHTPGLRAEWMTMLYQPTQWVEQLPVPPDPDPALIVKWRGVDGFFALAVWGVDGPNIMEFVD